MKHILQFTTSLLSIFLLVWAVPEVYLLIYKKQFTEHPAVQPYFILAIIVVFVCTFWLSSSIYYLAQVIDKSQNYKRKSDVYENILLIFSTLKSEIDPTQNIKLELDLNNLGACLALQASVNVVRAMGEFLVKCKSEGIHSPSTQIAFEGLVIAMRSDLGFGYSNPYLLKSEIKQLLSLFKPGSE